MKRNKLSSPLLKIFTIKNLKTRLLYTALILVFFRLVAYVPVPGINTQLLSLFFQQSQLLSLLDIFSGGTLANFSIIALGLNPYINASVLFQLLTFVSPKIEALSKEGEYGRAKIAQYTRIATIPLSLIQSFAVYAILQSQGLIGQLDAISLVTFVLSLITGTMIMMFLGQMIDDYGLGNGVSMIIFTGIVSRLPVSLLKTLGSTDFTDIKTIASIGIFALLSIAMVFLIVLVEEAVLKVPIHYAKRGQQTFLPIKIDTTGVMPIIFAVSLASGPSMIAQFTSQMSNPTIQKISQFILTTLNTSSIPYIIFYFVMVFVFTYFYSSVVFKPQDIADNLRKSGAFIPGIRPGDATKKRLSFLINRVVFIGAFFLASIAVAPSIVQNLTGITSLTIGGTGVLIVISVIIELSRKVENAVEMYNYDEFVF